jgi:hypothetical protein
MLVADEAQAPVGIESAGQANSRAFGPRRPQDRLGRVEIEAQFVLGLDLVDVLATRPAGPGKSLCQQPSRQDQTSADVQVPERHRGPRRREAGSSRS